MKLIAVPLVSVLLAACAANERIVVVSPQCDIPPVPALPDVDMGELWDHLGDSRYRELERYINGVWAYADEMKAILGEVCSG